MQPSSSDSLRPCGSFSDKTSSAKPKTDIDKETPSLSLTSSFDHPPSDADRGHEIRCLFARMKMSISSLMGELHGRESTVSGLLIELLIGSEILTYELDEEIVFLCAAGQTAESQSDAGMEETVARRASALSRIRHQVLVLQRSLKVLLDTTAPVLEQYSATIGFVFQPSELEGKGVDAVLIPYRKAMDSAVDIVGGASAEAVKLRDFHGGALLAALASNLNDFNDDLRPMLDAVL